MFALFSTLFTIAGFIVPGRQDHHDFLVTACPCLVPAHPWFEPVCNPEAPLQSCKTLILIFPTLFFTHHKKLHFQILSKSDIVYGNTGPLLYVPPSRFFFVRSLLMPEATTLKFCDSKTGGSQMGGLCFKQ